MDPRVQKIVRLMQENFNQELTLEEFAQSVNLSVWRLSHIFKSEIGLSPIHYLRSLRMVKAGNLLETSFLSVKEIAHAVGINDESHFVRDFKIIYGVTPTRYRVLLQDLHPHDGSDLEAMNPQSKIRQQIAKAAKQTILPSLSLFIYIITSLAKGCELSSRVVDTF